MNMRPFLFRKRLVYWIICFGLSLLTCFGLGAQNISAQALKPIAFKVLDQPIAPVNDRLFGHLLERASWGEPGPEVALQPGTGQIEPAAVDLMQKMDIPVMRFPGGTDVDYTDWRDLISNVPGRSNEGAERPVTIGHSGKEITNRFGLDEYFQLRDVLSTETKQTETILVVNFLDAVSGKVPLSEAALNAAGIIAYTNAPAGTLLPEGMPDWPAIRAKNGHPEPYKVEYLQIGNELWIQRFQQRVQEGTGLKQPAALAQWYLKCLKAYIEAIDSVDPSISLILDGTMGQAIEKTVLADPEIRSRVKYVTFHDYAPGLIDGVKYKGESIPNSLLIDSDWWKAWVAMPGRFSPEGVNVALGDRLQFTRSLGYKVVVTEWNWNGWGMEALDLSPDTNWRLASGLGTAGFLNGLMRQGNDIEMACQSLLIGANWDITSIRVDPTNKSLPYLLPQGQMTLFYSNHHGSRLLNLESANVPNYPQPYSMGWVKRPENNIATIDLVATADDQMIYLHAINRAQNKDLPIELDLTDFPKLGRSAVHHLFTEQKNTNWLTSLWNWIKSLWSDSNQAIGKISSHPFQVQDQAFTVTLPKQSVSIFTIPRT